MRFQTKPVEISVYKVGSPEGREALLQHLNAFESKNLWDCWEIRTPGDSIALVTREDWIAIDGQNGIYPIQPEHLMENYVPVGPITHCLSCGNPTGYEGIAALPLRNEPPLCLDCAGSTTPPGAKHD